MSTVFNVNGKLHKMEMRDENNIDWSADFIGNTGHGMKTDEDGYYIASQEELEWWRSMIASYQAMQAKIESYEEKYGRDEVQDWLEASHAWLNDLEDQPSAVLLALRELDAEMAE